MNPLKWFQKKKEVLPEPTEEEKVAAEAFKQILKYGEDIGGMWRDVTRRQDEIYKEKYKIKEICEAAIIKQQGIKLKKGVMRHDWNSIYIREYKDCSESPLGCCVTMMEYGKDNPERDLPQHCFYCSKEC